MSEDLAAAGLPADELRDWLGSEPRFSDAGDRFEHDVAVSGRFLTAGERLFARLPAKPERSEVEERAAVELQQRLRAARRAFLRAHTEEVYETLTGRYDSFVRVDELLGAGAVRFPGLLPTRERLAAEGRYGQKDKDGAEIDQGLFLTHVFSVPRAGLHLLHAMLRPKPESVERLDELRRTGVVDLDRAVVRREGKAGYVELCNPRFLNAEDATTNAALETAVDLVLLDPEIEVGVLRGATVEHPRYRGRRVFNAGINLTHLYHGKIPFEFYLTRDLGLVNKIYRGHSSPELRPEEPEATTEKPWIAAVEAFAIGGGCQLLLVVDRVLAETGAFFNLPARKEGIIPGAANLRLARFVGSRAARQGILFDRQFPAESPEGRLLCDQVVERQEMDDAIAATVTELTSSGVVSAAGNRRALRVAEEPLDVFRQYMATYTLDQAACHFSPALIRNLEVHWKAHERQA